MSGDENPAADAGEKTRARRLTGYIFAFPIIILGAALVLKHYKAGIAGAILLLLVAIAGTIVLIRAIDMRMERMGCGSPALSRYNARMLYGSIAYMAALFGSVYAHGAKLVTGPLLWILAMLPAMGILAMVWAMFRLLVEEQDEYLRFRLVRQALFASGGLLAIASVWGFLEQFALVSHVPAWAAVPIYAVLLGVCQCFKGFRQ